MKKRGFFSRLFGPREFEASRQWEPSLVQPIAEPRPIGLPRMPVDQSHIMPRYFDLNWKHALASGFFVGLCAGLLFMPSAFGEDGRWYAPFVAAGASFSIVSAVVWFILLIWDRKTLAWLERQLGVDIDRDGSVGEPRKLEPFQVEWTDPQRKRIELQDWAVSEEKVVEVAKAWQKGVALSKRELAKHTSLSEDAALELLRYMRSKALAIYADGNTTVLSGRGEYLFKRMLAE